jgi:signal transduction histidine kinase
MLDNRIIAVMRFVLAFSALLITYIDPSEPAHFAAATYSTLVLYTIYSCALYVVARRYEVLDRRFGRWAHWMDVAWYVVLITLSNGTNSIFFFGFFFAILVAAFRYGFTEAWRVITVSMLFFIVIGITIASDTSFELNRFLIRPMYMLVFGFMLAYWGEFELVLNRRLALLKEVNTFANPRFGIDRTTGWLLERLRSFYNADACMLVTVDPVSGAYRLRRADRHDPERAMASEPLPDDVARQFTTLPDSQAVLYNGGPERPWRRAASFRAYDIETHLWTDGGRGVSQALAALLDAVSFISVPLNLYGIADGRLYLTSSRRHAFRLSDVNFVLQVISYFTPVAENIRLVDRLASDAAEAERRRIAHDLHDSVIQPYIGLQLGLTAINQKLEAGNTDVIADNQRLIAQISKVVANLRGYMQGLKSIDNREDSLLPAVRRFATTFTETTGIAVHVDAAADMQLNDRLAAEVFQMVTEGLSNIRRHTHSMDASIAFARQNNHLVLHIEDKGSNGSLPAPFSPRSITERATALGGRVHVETRDGGSAVVIEIPL